MFSWARTSVFFCYKVHAPIMRHLNTSFLFAIKEIGVSAKFKLKEDMLLSVTTDTKYFKLRDCLRLQAIIIDVNQQMYYETQSLLWDKYYLLQSLHTKSLGILSGSQPEHTRSNHVSHLSQQIHKELSSP